MTEDHRKSEPTKSKPETKTNDNRQSLTKLKTVEKKQESVKIESRHRQESDRPQIGGLLKLNTDTLSQLKASQEVAKSNDEDENFEVKQYVKNFRNLKYSHNAGRANNDESPEIKMLFNPNNPDKPIYKQIQHSKRERTEVRYMGKDF